MYELKLGIDSIAQNSKICAKIDYLLHTSKLFVQFLYVSGNKHAVSEKHPTPIGMTSGYTMFHIMQPQLQDVSKNRPGMT